MQELIISYFYLISFVNPIVQIYAIFDKLIKKKIKLLLHVNYVNQDKNSDERYDA